MGRKTSAFKGPFGEPGPVTQAQRDLFTRRFRRIRAPDPQEFQIQIAVMEWWRLAGNKDVTCYHTPNGELRDKRTAAKLKAMGVLPGVPDLTFRWHEAIKIDLAAPDYPSRKELRLLYLELKAPGGVLSDPQIDFKVRAAIDGAYFEMANSVDAAIRIITKYGLTKATPR